MRIVEIVESRDVPLIEDAVYGELHFNEGTELPMQAHSTKGLVITCGSFSKTAAPSYRVGWILSHRFEEKAKGLKRALSCSSSLLNQMVIYEFVRSGDYDRHLKRLIQVLRVNKERMLALISEYFPENTCLSNPQGGGVIWLELPAGCDAIELFRRSVEIGISITPGVLFSASGKYKRCARISYGLPWDDKVEKAIEALGQISHELVERKT